MRTRTVGAWGTALLLSCVPCASLAKGPATPASPPSMSVITYKMSGVAGDLSKKETGEPVQVQEKRIVRDLDDLIAALEKECANCRGGGRAPNNPKKPAPDSIIHGGTGGIGDLVDPGLSEKDWAKLSARERDRILQSMSEGFPPEYRTVLERYYRRLAEEKSATAASSGTADAAAAKSGATSSSDKR